MIINDPNRNDHHQPVLPFFIAHHFYSWMERKKKKQEKVRKKKEKEEKEEKERGSVKKKNDLWQQILENVLMRKF